MIAHPPIDDAIFAVALAAWWQLRWSAHLLPHLRKGPSLLRLPVCGLDPWIASIGANPVRMTRPHNPQAGRPALDTSGNEQATDVFDTESLRSPRRSGPEESAPSTVPMRFAGDRRRPLPPLNGQAGPPTDLLPRFPIAVPRPRSSLDLPTEPSLAVGVGAGDLDQGDLPSPRPVGPGDVPAPVDPMTPPSPSRKGSE